MWHLCARMPFAERLVIRINPTLPNLLRCTSRRNVWHPTLDRKETRVRIRRAKHAQYSTSARTVHVKGDFHRRNSCALRSLKVRARESIRRLSPSLPRRIRTRVAQPPFQAISSDASPKTSLRLQSRFDQTSKLRRHPMGQALPANSPWFPLTLPALQHSSV